MIRSFFRLCIEVLIIFTIMMNFNVINVYDIQNFFVQHRSEWRSYKNVHYSSRKYRRRYRSGIKSFQKIHFSRQVKNLLEKLIHRYDMTRNSFEKV